MSVTLAGTGKTITAKRTGGSETGTSNSFTVNAGALNHFAVEAAGGGNIGSHTVGVAFDIKRTAQDVANNTVTSYDANGNKAQITSSGTLSSGGGLTPAFTLGVLAPHSVTFSNTGDFTITAVGSGSNGGTGTSNTFSVIKATPAFSNLSSPSISYSTSPTVLSGNLSLSPMLRWCG